MAPVTPINTTEKRLLKTCQEVLGASKVGFCAETNFFQWGATSLDIIKLKGHLQQELDFGAEIPLTTILSNPTVHSLAQALTHGVPGREAYTPAVVLQPKGSKVPLWLFHPDNGEVLVFLNLARYITDRPVIALRARGFDQGESFFSSVTEVVNEYHKSIKAQQPYGPYALAGCEYSSVFACEVAKVLRDHGDEVRFLGIFSSSLYNRVQSSPIDWSLCLLDLAVSLRLLSEQHRASVWQYFPALVKGEAVQHIQHASDPTRMAELCLTGEALVDWADVAFSLKRMVVGYQLSGEVDSIDVFYGVSTPTVTKEEDWFAKHLSAWAEFGGDVKIYEIEGNAHSGILGLGSAATLQKTLNTVLLARGV
jgi:acyl carrier protein